MQQFFPREKKRLFKTIYYLRLIEIIYCMGFESATDKTVNKNITGEFILLDSVVTMMTHF